jgi:N-acetylglucosamine kinase-like BadF-type ATPase
MSPTERSAGLRFIGVDGGGSKTLAVVVDAHGCECGRGHAGGSNFRAIGLERALTNVTTAVERALSACASVGTVGPAEAVWLGVAGVDRAGDVDLLLPQLSSLARDVRLTNDAELVLSGLDRCVGVALIAGTGSIALGRDGSGRAARAGGWGHLLGDEGSGYDLGRHALQAATRAADGRGRPTRLLDLICEAWELTAPEDLIARAHAERGTAGIARLSSLVFEANRSGDVVARGIARRAAAELALAAAAVADALGFGDDTGIPLALGGGLLLHEEAFRREVVRQIERHRRVRAFALVAEPALTAARSLAALAAVVSGAGAAEIK